MERLPASEAVTLKPFSARREALAVTPLALARNEDCAS